MPSPLPVATKLTFYATEIRYGDPEVVERYVLKAGNEALFGETFTQLPGGDLEMGGYGVAFADRNMVLILPLLPGFFSDLATRGDPFPRATIRIWEITRSLITSDQIVLELANGFMSTSTRNWRGKERLVGIRVSSEKDILDIPLGLPINAQCPWVFGSPLCGVTPPTFGGQIIGISNKEVEINAFSPALGLVGEEYFFRGYIYRNGVAIPIRGWDLNIPEVLQLAQSPPIEWLNQTITIVPGCDKQIETCRNRWSNEERFGGAGIKMPAYKPNFETPS